MKKQTIFLSIAAALALSACTAGGSRTETTETTAQPAGLHDGSWTVCLYLCGSNLESRQGWATKTLEELKSAEMPENVHFVIETGGTATWRNETVPSSENRRYIVENGNLSDLGTAGKGSMGGEETLADFLFFCETEYPAEHTAVILWDHGGGPLKGACFDETEDMDALTLTELDAAFHTGITAREGRKYDIVGFDACLMASLETAVLLDDDAQLMIASQEIESGAGWDYASFLQALGAQQTPGQAAKTLCDGYFAKCGSRGKSSTATLSVIDLTKTEDVHAALNDVCSYLLSGEESQIRHLRSLKFCTRTAKSFGGSSGIEGASNLVDLQEMAEANAGTESAWDRLAGTAADAVLYSVHGTAAEGANGLSLWFPQEYDASSLKDYAEISPLKAYASALETLFGERRGDVTFSDRGSVSRDNLFCVKISPDSADIFYDLYVVNRRTDGTYCDHNIDIQDDWDSLTFSYAPEWAVEITLNGLPLDAETIAYDEDFILFSCPVTLNGENTNLRICWFRDEQGKHKGHYELLGVWDGIDSTTGLAGRLDDTLKDGDIVGACSLETGEERETVTIAGGVVIEDIPMEPGNYECYFTAVDIYGNTYISDTARYKVTEDGRIL